MSGFDIPGPAQLEPGLIGAPLGPEGPVGPGDPGGPGGAGDPGGVPGTGDKGPGRLFEEALSGALEEVRSLQQDAESRYEALARGEQVEVHDLMIAVGKSEVAFNLMLEVRNKLLEAWQTLSRSVQ